MPIIPIFSPGIFAALIMRHPDPFSVRPTLKGLLYYGIGEYVTYQLSVLLEPASIFSDPKPIAPKIRPVDFWSI
jgi:hypothetical protein